MKLTTKAVLMAKPIITTGPRRLPWLIPFLSTFLLASSTISAAARHYKVLHAFGKSGDGGGVYGGLAFDSFGNLYGTTSGGGANGDGTVFELKLTSGGEWKETILHSFCRPRQCKDGALPSDTPVFDSKGALYAASNSTTFRMAPGPKGWSFKVIYDAGADQDPLLVGKGDSLYADYLSLGKNDGGAVSELSRHQGRWSERDLFYFCPKGPPCFDGGGPHFGLTWDAAGNLYGVTIGGGAYKWGVAYQLQHTSKGWKEHVLYDFGAFDGDGVRVNGGLSLDSATGTLYGTTMQGGGGGGCGGEGCGTVFQLSPGSNGEWQETILYNFPKLEDGAGPGGNLAIDAAGNVYGTAGGGSGPCGGGGCGVVYKLSPGKNGKWDYKVLHRFTGKDGALPVSGPALDSKGNVFGTTVAGGKYGAGVVYEITP